MNKTGCCFSSYQKPFQSCSMCEHCKAGAKPNCSSFKLQISSDSLNLDNDCTGYQKKVRYYYNHKFYARCYAKTYQLIDALTESNFLDFCNDNGYKAEQIASKIEVNVLTSIEVID